MPSGALNVRGGGPARRHKVEAEIRKTPVQSSPAPLEPEFELAATFLVKARARVASPGGTTRPPSALDALVQVWRSLPRHRTADRAAFALARRALRAAGERPGGSGCAAADDACTLLDGALAVLIAS